WEVILQSPSFDITQQPGEVFLSFWYFSRVGCHAVGAGELVVDNTVIISRNITVSTVGAWNMVKYNVTDLKGHSFYFRLAVTQGSYPCPVFMDDFSIWSITALPSCPQATYSPLLDTISWNTYNEYTTGMKIYVGVNGNGTATPNNLVNGTIITD